MTGKTNLAGSVSSRLLNRARETGESHQNLLTDYCLELMRLHHFQYREPVRADWERWLDSMKAN